MRQIFLILALLLVSRSGLADLDESILRDIAAWRPGEPPPASLLRFGNEEAQMPICHLRVHGDSVEDYIVEIENPDLLATILLSNEAAEESILAAARQMIRTQGVRYLAKRILAETAESEVSAPVALLRELITRPFAEVRLARIDFDEMPAEAAADALEEMGSRLQGGMSWDEAYRSASEAYPDPAAVPGTFRTLICYCYEGVVSSTGFDILTYRPATGFPVSHLTKLFRQRPRTAIFRDGEAVYLYFISSYYGGG